jgi:hypothetical protein
MVMASESPALSSQEVSLRKCWTPSSSRSLLHVVWPPPLKFPLLDDNQENDDEGCSCFVQCPVNTDKAFQSSVLSKTSIDFNDMDTSLNDLCSPAVVAAVPPAFIFSCTTPNNNPPLWSSRPTLERPNTIPQRRFSTSMTPDQPRMVKLKKVWITKAKKNEGNNSCSNTFNSSSLSNNDNGVQGPRQRVKLKAVWPPVPKPADSSRIYIGHSISPTDEISNLKVDVQSRRSSFDPKFKNKKGSSSSETVMDSPQKQTRQGFSKRTGVNLSSTVLQVKDRRLEFERKSSMADTTEDTARVVEQVQVMDSKNNRKSRTMEELMLQEAILTASLLEQQRDYEDATHHDFVLPSGQKLPKGSAQMYGKKKRRRTNYRIRYTGTTSLRMEDVYGNLMSVSELSDRFVNPTNGDAPPCPPRRPARSPHAITGRKDVDTMPSRPMHRRYDGDEENDADTAPRMPSRRFDSDSDLSDFSSEGQEYEDNKYYEAYYSHDDPRPDVWITPIPGANPKDRKWKVKRVWNVGQVDDQEIEHDVKNQDLMDFVRTLLGVAPKEAASESNNESSKNTVPCWHIQKCYDVDGEVETSEAEATVAEDGMIQEITGISNDCKDEFFEEDEDDDKAEYYYEEEKVEEKVAPRRQTSMHLDERAYFGPNEWISPTPEEKLNEEAAPRKLKVVEGECWSTKSSDTGEKKYDLLPADDTRVPETVQVSEDRSDEPRNPKEMPISKYDWMSPVTGARRDATKVIRTADREFLLKLWGQGF